MQVQFSIFKEFIVNLMLGFQVFFFLIKIKLHPLKLWLPWLCCISEQWLMCLNSLKVLCRMTWRDMKLGLTGLSDPLGNTDVWSRSWWEISNFNQLQSCFVPLHRDRFSLSFECRVISKRSAFHELWKQPCFQLCDEAFSHNPIVF